MNRKNTGKRTPISVPKSPLAWVFWDLNQMLLRYLEALRAVNRS